MQTPGQGKSQGDGDSRTGLLAVNDLNYVLAPDLSVTVNNTHKNHFFQSGLYTNEQRAICIFNSGADYADTRSSSLEFSISVQSSDPDINAFFGKNGSILNVIRSLVVTSRSGDELVRINDLNHLCASTHALRYNEEWMNTVGQSLGVGSAILNQAAVEHEAHFSIPLYCLTDLFGYGRLMPAMLLAGMRVEIEWETPSIAFQSVQSAGTGNTQLSFSSYTIHNPFISLRSVQLTDGTQRALNEMSAVNGLEIVYCDYERTESRVGSTASAYVEVRKAASRALKAYLRVREVIPDASGFDAFETEPFDYSRWQWQLGSLYFPQQPVKAQDPPDMIPESYKHSLIAFNTYRSDSLRRSALPLRQTGHWLDTVNTNLGTVDRDELSGAPFTIDTAGVVAVTTASEVAVGNKIVALDGAGKYHFFSVCVINSLGMPQTLTLEPAPAENLAATNMYYTREVPENSIRSTDDFYANNSWAQPCNPRYNIKASNNGKAGTFANGCTTICAMLERSDLFNLTGVPINNSRVLAALLEFAHTRERVVTIFLKYVRLARVFLNNVEVEQ